MSKHADVAIELETGQEVIIEATCLKVGRAL